MIILGVHGGPRHDSDEEREGFGNHDSAAVLLDDEGVVCAVEEERLDRIKHSNCFPRRAIAQCLAESGMTLRDVDCIAVNRDKRITELVARIVFLDDAGRRTGATAETMVSSWFERAFDVNVADRLAFCHHHLAHAWSAYEPSGFEEALVLVTDGDGDSSSGLVAIGRHGSLDIVRQYPVPLSLGHLYTRATMLLGYNRFDEYKVMGLAPYGDPSMYEGLLASCCGTLPDGEYWIASTDDWLAKFGEAHCIEQARRAGGEFSQFHKDIAAAFQQALERIVMHVLGHYARQTGLAQLCLAGGVAHNCAVNGKILYSGLFSRVFVQPAAHDAGGALGAAIWARRQAHAAHGGPAIARTNGWHETTRIAMPFAGRALGDDACIRHQLERWRDVVEIEAIDPIRDTAALLAGGTVIGWVQGRAEYGPRALGNRSILADPRPASNKALINAMVKKREAYRPFAPTVLEERVQDYFHVNGEERAFPFMTFALRVRDDLPVTLGAVTHVDGTARVQTVSRAANPLFWALINEFGRLTGVPVLLNTSFNSNVEPIVDSIDDAVVCYLTTGLQAFVAGRYLVRKRSIEAIRDGAWRMAIDVPASRRLLQTRTGGGNGSGCEIATTRSRYFGPTSLPISPELFSMLLRADGRASASELDTSGDAATVAALKDEIMRLWTARFVTLRPQPVPRDA